MVTHLVKDENNEKEKAVALLPQPLAIIDSGGATMSKGEVMKLVWINPYGQKVTAPKVGTRITAFYFQPEIAARK